MAKINFNNSSYIIDDSLLMPGIAKLQFHFLNKINGSGEAIHFNNQICNIDSTKLSNATNNFIKHLGAISGNGEIIKVNNIEYSIDSAKINEATKNIYSNLNKLQTESFNYEWVEIANNPEITGFSFFRAIKVPADMFQLGKKYKITYNDVDYISTCFSYGESSVCGIGAMVEGVLGSVANSENMQPKPNDYYPFGLSFSEQELQSGVVMFHTKNHETPSNFIIYEQREKKNNGYATFNDGAILSFEDLKLEANGIKYGYNASIISDLEIGKQAFENCTSIISIYAPTIDYVNGAAFFGSSLVSANLPNATFIENTAFSMCKSLLQVNLPKVKAINPGAFNNVSLTSIDLPSIEILASLSILSCNLLKTINLSRIKKISNNALMNCPSLTEIIFEGTVEEWNAVEKTGNWYLNIPATHVQCSDGQVAI